MIAQPLIARTILSAVGVLPTVYFDHQPLFPADEINHVTSDRLLPNEFVAVESAPTQPIPEAQLNCG